MDERNPLLPGAAAPTAPPLFPPAYESLGQPSQPSGNLLFRCLSAIQTLINEYEDGHMILTDP